MFENETTKILNAYSTSEKVLKKLHAIVKPYEHGQAKYEQIFYGICPHILSISSLDEKAHRALENILRKYNLDNLTYQYRGADELPIKQHAKIINKVTINDFYYSAFYRTIFNEVRYNTKSNIFIKNNTYEDLKGYNSKMFLILDCIYLLDNSEPINDILRDKIHMSLKNSNTFVFNGCKVTLYNNGRTIIKFSNHKLFKRFESKVNQTIKAIKKDLKRLEA